MANREVSAFFDKGDPFGLRSVLRSQLEARGIVNSGDEEMDEDDRLQRILEGERPPAREFTMPRASNWLRRTLRMRMIACSASLRVSDRLHVPSSMTTTIMGAASLMTMKMTTITAVPRLPANARKRSRERS